jgi:hypothetical protein
MGLVPRLCVIRINSAIVPPAERNQNGFNVSSNLSAFAHHATENLEATWIGYFKRMALIHTFFFDSV